MRVSEHYVEWSNGPGTIALGVRVIISIGTNDQSKMARVRDHAPGDKIWVGPGIKWK